MITTEEEYNEALLAIRPYFDAEPEPGTPEASEFERLAGLISDYEAEHEKM